MNTVMKQRTPGCRHGRRYLAEVHETSETWVCTVCDKRLLVRTPHRQLSMFAVKSRQLAFDFGS